MTLVKKLLNLVLCRVDQIGIVDLNRDGADIFLTKEPEIAG